jgi:hypothetical protein
MAVAIERWVPWAGDPDLSRRVLRLLTSTSVFSLSYLVAVKPLSEGLGLRRVLSEINIPLVSPLLRRLGGGDSNQGKP